VLGSGAGKRGLVLRYKAFFFLFREDDWPQTRDVGGWDARAKTRTRVHHEGNAREHFITTWQYIRLLVLKSIIKEKLDDISWQRNVEKFNEECPWMKEKTT
jgi:hypothetical protein